MALNNPNIPQYQTENLIDQETVINLQQALEILSIMNVAAVTRQKQTVAASEATSYTIDPTKRLNFRVTTDPEQIADVVNKTNIVAVNNPEIVSVLVIKLLYTVIRQLLTVLASHDSNSNVANTAQTLLQDLPNI